jgi:O-antigen/teichoic acid export membrane protein
LNVISLFVVGYIARTLGQTDYGVFNFALAFVAMFSPLYQMGLGTVTTRALTQNSAGSSRFFWKMMALRFFLSLFAIASVFLAVGLLHMPSVTVSVVHLAALTLLFGALTSTCSSALQGLQKMNHVAIAAFISGLVLTILSVVVLVLGLRLIGLTVVYVLGSALGACLSLIYVLRIYRTPEWIVDLDFWKRSLRMGFPFFLSGFVSTMGAKVGVVMLSKMHGDAAVGVYAAASGLVERLGTIPDGISTAVFPAMAALYIASRGDAGDLFRRVFSYQLMLALPIAVGTTVLAKPIILVIYGVGYLPSVAVLQLLAWWLFLAFLSMLFNYVLGAIHQERTVLRIAIAAAGVSVVVNAALIPLLGERGVAVAGIVSLAVTSLLSHLAIRKHLNPGYTSISLLARTASANVALGLLVYSLRDLNVLIPIVVGVAAYIPLLILCRAIERQEVMDLWWLAYGRIAGRARAAQ